MLSGSSESLSGEEWESGIGFDTGSVESDIMLNNSTNICKNTN